MNAGFPFFLSADAREAEALRGKSIWAIVFGAILVVVGVLALCYPLLATLQSALFFGVLLLVGGGVQAATAVWARGWGGFFLHLLVGLLYLFVGALFLERPLISAIQWTLVIAVFFVASGLVRVVSAVVHRFSGWGWSLLNGVVTLALGVLLWRGWPGDGLWVIGTLVGIELLFSGWSLVMLGLAVRSLAAPPGPP
jgi:uncharacterized membrane protein HdeD (DUF308 family)